MKRYTIYDQSGRFHVEYRESRPDNATETMYAGNYIDPRYNVQNDSFFEGATQAQREAAVEALRNEYDALIHDVIWLELEKKKMRDLIGEVYEMPEPVKNEYQRLRAEYNERKNQILTQ